MIELSLDEAVRLAKSFVEPNPDFIYRDPDGKTGYLASCVYVHETDDGLVSGCIVGGILNAAGVPLETLHEYDDSQHPSSKLLFALAGRNILTTLLGVKDFLDKLQFMQDCGSSWGSSLKDALEYVGYES